MKASRRARATRAVVVLGILFVGVGSWGVVRGIGGLTEDGVPTASVLTDPDSTDMAEAAEATQRVLYEQQFRAPLRRVLAGSNVVVSAILLWAGLLLLRRRLPAVWWSLQAAIANGLWAAVDAGSRLQAHLRERERLVALFDRQIETARQGESTPSVEGLELQIGGDEYLFVMLAGIAVVAAVWMGFYGWAAFRLRRPDVLELLQAAERERR